MDADVKSLATFKEKVESALVKDLLEPVIAILTNVKVGFSAEFSLSRSLISGTIRTGRYRRTRSQNWPVSVPKRVAFWRLWMIWLVSMNV
jgi:hypothetical protein